MILGVHPPEAPRTLPRVEPAPLNLAAVERVQRLSQRARAYLNDLVAAKFMSHAAVDLTTYLLLCDEAEAVMGA